MLLKLIPANSEPTIHFSLSFSDLPPHLPTPAAWTSQLAHLMLEDLEVPATMHSLDKSAGITSLLEEVALDVGANEIRCRFVDGKIEKWGFWDGIVGIGPWKAMAGTLYGQRLVDALQGIMRDVKESTFEDDRVAREKEWEKQKLERTRSLSTVTAPKGIQGKVSKHKKQRSFFMQIVSCVGSIINLTSPSTANHPALPFSRSSTSTPPVNYPISTSVTQSSNTTPPAPGTSARARALRRAARSALVDTYRLFVLSELITRLQGLSDPTDQQVVRSQEYRRKDKATFGVWILHSMRRRALERMEQLLEEAEVEAKARGCIASVNQDLNVAFFGMEPATTAVPLSFSDDEDEMEQPPPGLSSTKSEKETDGDSESDETDGSSVHTPSTTSHFQCYPMRPPFSRTSSSSSHSVDDSSSISSDDNKGYLEPVESQANL
ncbi:hypothetical protein CPB84DRAFT_1249160 [Gymnopilus junonius]|uniref:Uncharacterized protein n=1 Tax=Gymnopilus junonius TaxID=109634 RepID=A0A9P5NMD0_GYMJU|nr:hypothetical protein CPB84DRAFT_1249160 [Gymnopilus junonius]